LVRSGKVIYGGLANFPAWKTAAMVAEANILQSAPFAAMQCEYNLLQRSADRELLPMTRYFGLGAMCTHP